MTWRFLDSRYEITVSNPTRRCRGVVTATLDGAPVNARAIPLRNDGRTHDVQIVLGDQSQRERDAASLRSGLAPHSSIVEIGAAP